MKHSFQLLVLALMWLCPAVADAARVDTLQVRSAKMGRDIPVVVVVPDAAVHGETVPVLYLLHGAGDNENSWLQIQPELPAMADRDSVLVVCPDGELSWYWDSPINAESQFETFVARELVAYVDGHYPTVRDRRARAVSGLSMGGQGSMWLAFHHKEVFGAAGSTSGGLDIRPFAKNWGMEKQLGKQEENRERWEAYAMVNQVDRIKNGDLALIIDCGYQDFFFQVNCDFHEALLQRGIMHDFIVREGCHNHSYWRNSIRYQWLFFTRYFSKSR